MSANFKPKQTAAASRGFLATAWLSSLLMAWNLEKDPESTKESGSSPKAKFFSGTWAFFLENSVKIHL